MGNLQLLERLKQLQKVQIEELIYYLESIGEKKYGDLYSYLSNEKPITTVAIELLRHLEQHPTGLADLEKVLNEICSAGGTSSRISSLKRKKDPTSVVVIYITSDPGELKAKAKAKAKVSQFPNNLINSLDKIYPSCDIWNPYYHHHSEEMRRICTSAIDMAGLSVSYQGPYIEFLQLEKVEPTQLKEAIKKREEFCNLILIIIDFYTLELGFDKLFEEYNDYDCHGCIVIVPLCCQIHPPKNDAIQKLSTVFWKKMVKKNDRKEYLCIFECMWCGKNRYNTKKQKYIMAKLLKEAHAKLKEKCFPGLPGRDYFLPFPQLGGIAAKVSRYFASRVRTPSKPIVIHGVSAEDPFVLPINKTLDDDYS